jgi:hypothetical protein
MQRTFGRGDSSKCRFSLDASFLLQGNAQQFAHSLGGSERTASEGLSKKIGQKLAQLESGSEMESTPFETV